MTDPLDCQYCKPHEHGLSNCIASESGECELQYDACKMHTPRVEWDLMIEGNAYTLPDGRRLPPAAVFIDGVQDDPKDRWKVRPVTYFCRRDGRPPVAFPANSVIVKARS